MKDVQSQRDDRNVYLQRVGIRHLSYPITVMDKTNGYQDTVAKINMYVDLPEHFRGTHMSRFVEVLNKYRLGIDPKLIKQMLEELRNKLKASTARVEIEFPYFVVKKAPFLVRRVFSVTPVGSKDKRPLKSTISSWVLVSPYSRFVPVQKR